eukprot:g2216.t1
MAPGEIPKNAPCPMKMKVPAGATAFVWRIKVDDQNPDWMPTHKVSFEPPLSASTSNPRRVVLKVPLKSGASSSHMLPPTPVHDKLKSSHVNQTDEAYKSLIAHLEKTKEKFVDGSFDLSGQNCTTSSEIQWLRPCDLSKKPRVFPKEDKSSSGGGGDADDIDLRQGNIGDCWLIATLAMLYQFDRNLLHNLLVEYRADLGIVLCRFCKEGEWKFVLIDDRLPVVGSRLCYCHHDNTNIFWGPLIEKAYAKLHGGYAQIVGGRIQYASTDLTGHFSDSIDLDRWRREADADKDGKIDADEIQTLVRRLFDDREKHKSMGVKSMGGCSIRSAKGESVLASGLIAGHAYSILRQCALDLKSGEKAHLIELRNPWGMHEFTGEWSDKDERWKDPFIRNQLDFEPDEDGSFWMSLEEFLRTFDDVYTVPFWHSSDGNVFVDVERGEWIEATSGGCGAGPGGVKKWASNPQYQFHWEREDGDKSVLKCFLYQEDKIWKDTKFSAEDVRAFPAISVQVWKQENNGKRIDAPLKRLKIRTPSYTRTRHVTITLDDLPKGTYVLVPTTFRAGELGEFVLGVCSSERVELEHLEVEIEAERKLKRIGTYSRRKSLDVDGSFFGDNVATSPTSKETRSQKSLKYATSFFEAPPVCAPPPSPGPPLPSAKEEEETEEEDEEEEEGGGGERGRRRSGR